MLHGRLLPTIRGSFFSSRKMDTIPTDSRTHTHTQRERERDACFALVTSRTHRNSHASTAASRTMACCLLDCHLYTVCSREKKRDQKHHHPKHQQNEMNSPIGQQRACGIKCDFHHIGNLPTQFGSPLQSNINGDSFVGRFAIVNCRRCGRCHPERI